MKLSQLMEGLDYLVLQGDAETEVADVAYDSRKVQPGFAFVCVVGTNRDSHDYAEDVAAAGASVLVIQHKLDEIPAGVTVVQVENSRHALAIMSCNLFGNPAKKMTMIGVTGTKGKTTTAHMIQAALNAAGKTCGIIGTNGTAFAGERHALANTTPESYELQKLFSEMLTAGCDSVVMEVSSQGLMMSRVDGIHFDVGVFTNLYPDHIGGPGEHQSFEEYRAWKGQLFRRCDVGVDMPGEFSVYNSLAALAVGQVLGLDREAVCKGLEQVSVKGRVELVPVSKRFTVLIDFAHNEAGTENLLTTLRAYQPKRLVVLFGCGGDRSRLRRYGMGEVASRLADFLILTEDNNRFEEVEAILADIKIGIVQGRPDVPCVEIPDRLDALHYALDHAQDGDMIAVIGKGHETYRDRKGKKTPFLERELLLEYAQQIGLE